MAARVFPGRDALGDGLAAIDAQRDLGFLPMVGVGLIEETSKLIIPLALLIFFLGLVWLGVWLTDEVAAVGRANGQCLTSARRVCGMFPAQHAWQPAAPLGRPFSS